MRQRTDSVSSIPEQDLTRVINCSRSKSGRLDGIRVSTLRIMNEALRRVLHTYQLLQREAYKQQQKKESGLGTRISCCCCCCYCRGWKMVRTTLASLFWCREVGGAVEKASRDFPTAVGTFPWIISLNEKEREKGSSPLLLPRNFLLSLSRWRLWTLRL